MFYKKLSQEIVQFTHKAKTIFCNLLDIQYPCIIYHLKDINECGLWITSPNKKEVIVLIKMDLKYKKQNIWNRYSCILGIPLNYSCMCSSCRVDSCYIYIRTHAHCNRNKVSKVVWMEKSHIDLAEISFVSNIHINWLNILQVIAQCAIWHSW